MRGAGDVVGAADEGNLILVLDFARAVHGRLQGRGVDAGAIGGARAERLVLDELGRALVGVEGVDLRAAGDAVDVVAQVVDVVHLVGVVETGGVGGGRRRAEPVALLGLRVGYPDDERVEGNVVGDGTAGVVDAGDVVEAGGLAVVGTRSGPDILSALAELGAQVRVAKLVLGFADEIDDAALYAELLGDFAGVILGWSALAIGFSYVVLSNPVNIPGYLPLRISLSERFLLRELHAMCQLQPRDVVI